jgi:hypothetical protein
MRSMNVIRGDVASGLSVLITRVVAALLAAAEDRDAAPAPRAQRRIHTPLAAAVRARR